MQFANPAPEAGNIYAAAASERYRNNAAFDSVYVPDAVALDTSINLTKGTLFYWGQGEQQNNFTTGTNGFPNGKPAWAVQGDIKLQKLEGGRIREVVGLGVQIVPHAPSVGDPRWFADAQAILQRVQLFAQLQGQEEDCLGPLFDMPAGVGLSEGLGVFTTANTRQFAAASNGQAVSGAVRMIPQPFLIGATQQKIWLLASGADYTPVTASIIRVKLLGGEKQPIPAG